MLRQALLCSTVANTTPNFLRVQGSGFRPVDGFRPFVAYNCPSKCPAETPIGGRFDLGQTHKLTSTTSFSRQPLQTTVEQSEAELVPSMRSRLTQLLPQLNASGQVLCGRSAVSPYYTALTASCTRGFADDSNLLKTPLHDFHVENGGEQNATVDVKIIHSVCSASLVLTLRNNFAAQARWCPLLAGRCPSSTKKASWTLAYTAERMQPYSTSRICVARAFGCAIARILNTLITAGTSQVHFECPAQAMHLFQPSIECLYGAGKGRY